MQGRWYWKLLFWLRWWSWVWPCSLFGLQEEATTSTSWGHSCLVPLWFLWSFLSFRFIIWFYPMNSFPNFWIHSDNLHACVHLCRFSSLWVRFQWWYTGVWLPLSFVGTLFMILIIWSNATHTMSTYGLLSRFILISSTCSCRCLLFSELLIVRCLVWWIWYFVNCILLIYMHTRNDVLELWINIWDDIGCFFNLVAMELAIRLINVFLAFRT